MKVGISLQRKNMIKVKYYKLDVLSITMEIFISANIKSSKAKWGMLNGEDMAMDAVHITIAFTIKVIIKMTGNMVTEGKYSVIISKIEDMRVSSLTVLNMDMEKRLMKLKDWNTLGNGNITSSTDSV